MPDKIVLLCLGVWALLTGLFAVTNLHIVWSGPLAGFATLACDCVFDQGFSGTKQN